MSQSVEFVEDIVYSNIPLLVFLLHLVLYGIILCTCICQYQRKTSKRNASDGEGSASSKRMSALNRHDILSDLDGNTTDHDMFYETKIKIGKAKSQSRRYSITDISSRRASRSSPATPAKLQQNVSANTVDLPDRITEEFETSAFEGANAASVHNDSSRHELVTTTNTNTSKLSSHDSSETGNSAARKPSSASSSSPCVLHRCEYLQLFLYIANQSSYLAAPFVYHAYSRHTFAAAAAADMDVYFLLFAISALHILLYKCTASIIIVAITRNCAHFFLQWLNVLIFQQRFSNIFNLKGRGDKNDANGLWIVAYIQSMHAILCSLPQCVLAIIFVLHQLHTAPQWTLTQHWLNHAVVAVCILSSILSLVASACHCNICCGAATFGVYLCRLLEVTARLVLLLLMWRCLGSFVVSVVFGLELVYILAWCISSRNLLLMNNLAYIVCDEHGARMSKFFVAYRLVSTYLLGVAIAVSLSMDALPLRVPGFTVANYDALTYGIDDAIWLCLFGYCFVANIVAHLLLFCRFGEHLQSIGQCSDFQQLLRHKCWNAIHELMALGFNYTKFAKHNTNNILCHVCLEPATELIHLKIADLYLSEHKNTFVDDECPFYLPFFNAIQSSTIRMMTLLISHGANIETLFENCNWHNALQVIIQSPHPSMNKFNFLIKRLQQRYQRNPREYDDKIGAFLNYQNGDNYDTALSLLFATNDYEMMRRGFDRLEALEYLIWNGANCNIVDAKKCSVLHYAVEHKEHRVIRMLIKNGADISLANGLQQLPLSIACRARCDNLETLQFLLYGNSLHATASCATLKDRFASYDCMTEILQHRDVYGRTALHYAGVACTRDVVHFLIEKNADCNIGDNDGLSALHYAIRYNMELSLETVALLVANGQSAVDSADHQHCSVLHDAVKYQTIEIVDYLIQMGADVYCVDYYGETPQHWSVRREDADDFKSYWRQLGCSAGHEHELYEEMVVSADRKRFACDHEELPELEKVKSLEAFQDIIRGEVLHPNEVIHR